MLYIIFVENFLLLQIVEEVTIGPLLLVPLSSQDVSIVYRIAHLGPMLHDYFCSSKLRRSTSSHQPRGKYQYTIDSIVPLVPKGAYIFHIHQPEHHITLVICCEFSQKKVQRRCVQWITQTISKFPFDPEYCRVIFELMPLFLLYILIFFIQW